MKRTIIKIDESKCTGCGLCVEGCHEGALQLINGKAVMISELFCDGLGACIGECPEGAIELEEREAEPYSETAVMERIVPKGEAVILAHLKHLKDHGQTNLLNEGLDYLAKHQILIDTSSLTMQETIKNTHSGCPGARSMDFSTKSSNSNASVEQPSQLQQWPVQLHLLSPLAPYLQNVDLLLAADCTAFAVGNFHEKFLKGKRLAIACPKLDSGKEVYIEKLTEMIDSSNINSLTVMIMEVPCCGGLLKIAQTAQAQAKRKIPIKLLIVSLQGDIIKDEWVF